MPKVKVKGGISSPSGDIGVKRAEFATKAVKPFKGDGKVMKASSYFGSAKPFASKEGNNPG